MEEVEVYFWAPPGVFEKCIEGSEPIKSPCIQVVVMNFPAEEGKNILDEYISEMKSYFPHPFHLSTFHWGKYEVKSVKMKPTADLECLAFVDLTKENGNILMFSLVYHKKLEHGNGNQPSLADMKFWGDFLKKTKSF